MIVLKDLAQRSQPNSTTIVYNTMSCPVEEINDTGVQLNPLLDPSTFVFPPPLSSTTVVIEFCDRVGWRICTYNPCKIFSNLNLSNFSADGKLERHCSVLNHLPTSSQAASR